MRWVESDDEVEEEEEEGKVEEKEKEREKSRRESFAEIEGIKHTSERVNVELEALGGGGGGVGVLLHGVQHALELESTNEGINRRISRSREVVYGFNSITNNTITTTTKTTTLPSKPQFIDRNLLLSPDHEPVISSPDRRGGLRRKSSKLTQGSARTRSVSPVVSALRLTPSALSPGGHIKLQGEVDLFGEKVGAGLLGAVAEAEKEVEGEVEREREIVVPEVIVDSVDDESKVVEAEEEEQYYEEAELEVTEIAEEDLSRLLGLCTESRTVPFEEHISTLLETSTLRKLGEASYSEVYICEPHPPTPTTTGTSTSTPLLPPKTVLKIIPFGKPSQCPISQILGELLITRTMSPVPGFVGFHSAHVCVGAFPQHLLDLWDYWDEEIKESENDRPDFYESDQLFAVIGLEDGGRDLESFELEGWAEARTVFWDTAVALARGECRREFEHRDMHFGNIVIKRVEVEAVGDGSEEEEEQGGGGVEGMLQALTLDSSSKTKAKSKNKKSAGGKKQQPQQEKSTRLKVTLIDYTLSRAMCEDGSLMFTPLDDEALFEGKGDYQFDVYRFMRTLFLAHHPDNTSAPLTPQTDPNATPHLHLPRRPGPRHDPLAPLPPKIKRLLATLPPQHPPQQETRAPQAELEE
ncbi:hypothetical protein DFH27DRAFT_564138 [Peziza echinospora]|nr:hypothetical protein DFH27DRAFT_564138 [Peziza echinospora]